MSFDKGRNKVVYKGLQLAKGMDIPKLWVQLLDSRLVVDMLSGKVAWSMEHVPLLRRCMKLIQAYEWETKITHCYREANQVADKLANMGVELHIGCNIYQDPPCEVREVMHADNVRAAWPRMIRSE